MCEKEIEDPQGKYGEKISKYHLEAAKYAGRISAGDFSQLGTNGPTFLLDSKDFTPRLIAELDELYKTDKESLDRVVKEAVFRIFKARHKMIFYQYIQGEPFSMEVCIISMSIPEKEKGDEVSAPPTNREEEEDREDEVELLAGVSSEDCHPPEEREGEQREKGDESVIQKEKKDTTKPTEDEERFLAENLPSNHIRAQDKQKKDDSEPKIPQVSEDARDSQTKLSRVICRPIWNAICCSYCQ